ncbi:rifin [Plasmodium reichenowi]|uniref:Rifin n=1 Tax=Plasmodium reichenowi TaxID=5854 RepID=A0A060RQQ1_PLARE|nr:rifin [Plasmodium reichenowi]
MKLNYFKILLFFILLNILVTLYHAYNNNEPSITPHHTPIYKSRQLSECNIQSSNYDNDPQMKKVMNTFNRQTSQRLRKYDERLQEKRQKRKEQRDKNIQKIIEEDKMEKSLAEKVEKGCLRCGCALGGGVLPVWGLVSGLWYATLSQHVTKLAIEKGIEKGIEVGLANVMKIADPSLSGQAGTMPPIEMLRTLTTGKFTDGVTLHDIFKCIYYNIYDKLQADGHQIFAATVKSMALKTPTEFNSGHLEQAEAVVNAFKDAEAAEFAGKTGLLSNTIIASVVTIIIIVLIMVIIYLVLRYRRKKKVEFKVL